MIFGVATNEDRRQRSDNPKLRSPADLDYIASLTSSSIAKNNFFSCGAYKSKRGAFSEIMHYAFLIMHCRFRILNYALYCPSDLGYIASPIFSSVIQGELISCGAYKSKRGAFSDILNS